MGCEGFIISETETNIKDPHFALFKRLTVKITNDENVEIYTKAFFENLNAESRFKISENQRTREISSGIKGEITSGLTILPNTTFSFDIYFKKRTSARGSSPLQTNVFTIEANIINEEPQAVFTRKVVEVSHKWCSGNKNTRIFKKDSMIILNSYFVASNKEAPTLEILLAPLNKLAGIACEEDMLEKIACESLLGLANNQTKTPEAKQISQDKSPSGNTLEKYEVPTDLIMNAEVLPPDALSRSSGLPIGFVPFHQTSFPQFTQVTQVTQFTQVTPPFSSAQVIPRSGPYRFTPYPKQRCLSEKDEALLQKLRVHRDSIKRQLSNNAIDQKYGKKILEEIEKNIRTLNSSN